jgi:hypothetical protein
VRNRIYRLSFAIVAALYANVAAAHAVLVSSSPANGSMLTQPPKEIRLSFNEAIEARFSSVTLTRSDGRRSKPDARPAMRVTSSCLCPPWNRANTRCAGRRPRRIPIAFKEISASRSVPSRASWTT